MQRIHLTASELVELTGYRQRRRQLIWLRECLNIRPPLRADGLPVVSRAAVEAALSGHRPQAAVPAPNAPKWKTAVPA